MTKKKIKKILSKETLTEHDFVEALDLTMQQQLAEHPALKSVYKKLTPEFESLVRLVATMFETQDDAEEQAIFLNLLKEGEPALLAALEYLLHIKKPKVAI